MSANKNNFDELIKQKLAGHKAKAPAQAWEKLNADLRAPSRTRFFWIIRSAAAAILLLIAFSAGYYFSELNRDEISLAENTQTESQESISNPDAQIIRGENTNDALVSDDQATGSESGFSDNSNQIEPALTNKSSEPESIIDYQIASLIPDETESANSSLNEIEAANLADDTQPQQEVSAPDEITQNNNAVAVNQEVDKSDDENEESPIPADDVPVMTDEMLREMLLTGQDDFADNIFEEDESTFNSKWSIGGRLSPMYSYRTIQGESFETPDETVDVGYFNDNEEGLTTLAGGISLDYNFNKRLSLGSGMYLSRIGQQNNEVLAFNDPQTPSGMFKLATSSGTITINPGKFESVIVEQAASAKDSLPGDYSINGSFVQNLDYLEVPLVLKYKVIDSKFSLKVLGGLSPGILVNNRSYFTVEGQKLQTGTTENIEPFIYNSVVGFGLEYLISKKVAFSMEPSFKYSLSPVNSGSNLRYHPYSLSVFTGISYRLD